MTARRENIRRMLLDLLQECVGLIQVELSRYRPDDGSPEIGGVELMVQEVRLVTFKSSGKFENIGMKSARMKRLPIDLYRCSLHVIQVERALHGTEIPEAKSAGS